MQNRINKKLFKKVFEKGTFYNGNLLYIKVFKFSNDKEKRYSFVVSKSVSKYSVKRNLLKRKARHIVRTNINKIKNGYAIIFFFTKENSLKMSFKEIELEIINVLTKSGLIS